MPTSSYQTAYERANPPVERIGDILRRARERRGDDLYYIAEYLCIRRSFLEALEDSRYEEFPADAYVIGFLRSYAELLGFDGKEAVDLYRSEMAGRRKKPTLSMPTAIPEGRSPSAFVMIGALAAVILIYATWYGLSSSDRATVTTPPPLPTTTHAVVPVVPPRETASAGSPSSAASNAAAPNAAASNAAASNAAMASREAQLATQQAASAQAAALTAAALAPSSSAPQPIREDQPNASTTSMAQGAKEPAGSDIAQVSAAAKPAHLVIRADQSSWVLVNDGKGKALFDKVLKPGETFNVPDGAGETLTTGNGAGIALIMDGIELPKLSASSSGTIRDISLDADRLKARTAIRN